MLMSCAQVDIAFHNVGYILTVSTANAGSTLCLDVEQKSDASHWKGEFDASCEWLRDLLAAVPPVCAAARRTRL